MIYVFSHDSALLFMADPVRALLFRSKLNHPNLKSLSTFLESTEIINSFELQQILLHYFNKISSSFNMFRYLMC